MQSENSVQLPMEYLGYTASDVITGFNGVITGFCGYLTGCNQYLVQPRMDASGKVEECRWIDQQRLLISRVIEPIVLDNTQAPGFDKPAPRR